MGVDVGGCSLVPSLCVYRGMPAYVTAGLQLCACVQFKGGLSGYVVVGLQFCLSKCLWCVCELHVGGRGSVYTSRGRPAWRGGRPCVGSSVSRYFHRVSTFALQRSVHSFLRTHFSCTSLL